MRMQVGLVGGGSGQERRPPLGIPQAAAAPTHAAIVHVVDAADLDAADGRLAAVAAGKEGKAGTAARGG